MNIFLNVLLVALVAYFVFAIRRTLNPQLIDEIFAVGNALSTI